MATTKPEKKEKGKKEIAKTRRRTIQDQLAKALAGYKTKIGNKKFDSLVKKAGKSFAAAIKPTPAKTKKPVKAKKKAPKEKV